VVLALVYYTCPMLCTQVLSGLAGSLQGVTLNVGKDY
jgi:protein SCO1/2